MKRILNGILICIINLSKSSFFFQIILCDDNNEPYKPVRSIGIECEYFCIKYEHKSKYE